MVLDGARDEGRGGGGGHDHALGEGEGGRRDHVCGVDLGLEMGPPLLSGDKCLGLGLCEVRGD